MRSVFLVLCLWLGLSIAAKADEPALRLGFIGKVASLNPVFADDDLTRYALGFVHRPLTAFNEQWQPVCLLCTTLPTVENGLAVRAGDGLKVTVTVQDKAVWGDGTPITANDVRFSWQVAQQLGRLALPITDVTVQDAKTAILHMATLDYRYNWLHLLPLLPEHVESPVFKNDFAGWPTQARYEQNPLDPGLYNGPYRVVERLNEALILEQNRAWWADKPYFARIRLSFYATQAAMLDAFKAGELDMIPSLAQLPLDTPVSENHRAISTVNLFFEQLTVNHADTALQDIRVRQALLLGIDRPAMNNAVYRGKAVVTSTFLHPLDTMQYSQAAAYDFDPQRAGVLLDEAGWQKDKQGQRFKNGQRLRLTIATTGDDSARALTQQILQNYWEQLGIEVVLTAPPAAELFNRVLPQRAFTGLALYALTSAPELLPYTALASRAIPSAANGYRGQNFGGFTDTTVDDLLVKLTQDISVDSRRQLWQALQNRYAETLPSLPLFFLPEIDIVPLAMAGFEPTGHVFPPSLWAERWLISLEPR